MLKRFLAGFAVAVMLAGVAVAGPLEDATAAWSRGDYVEVVKLVRPVAEQGNVRAQYNLGFMYANGQGVPQDHVLAHMWLNLAAAQGNFDAVKNRNIATSKMTPDQLAEAQRLAREWKPSP